MTRKKGCWRAVSFPSPIRWAVSSSRRGVESEQEYYECRNLGCDMVQGYLIQKPELDLGDLRKDYVHVLTLCEKDRRTGGHKDVTLLQAEIEYIRPIQSDAPPIDLLDAFKNNTLRTFFPILTSTHEPIGIIRESSIKALHLFPIRPFPF